MYDIQVPTFQTKDK